MSEALGFIGTGNLGGALVTALLKAGYAVTIFDTDQRVLAPLATAGAKVAASPRSIGDEAAIVFACLPTPEVCCAVALDENGVSAGKAIQIYVETSTLGLDAVAAIGARMDARSIAFLDNPIVGGGGGRGVAEGKMATISAGPREAFDRIAPILHSIARNIFYVGEEQGQAQICKCINAALAITGLTITCEAMVLGAKAGIDAQLLLDIVNAGSGRNVTTEERFGRDVLTRRFSGNQLRIASKDMKLYAETAHHLGLPALVGSAIGEIWNAASTQEFDHLVQFFERFAGVEVKN
jgi:3-hydroxyisobutyrate dehydrogenase-like beta-hydroxyacid dehydrogenase